MCDFCRLQPCYTNLYPTRSGVDGSSNAISQIRRQIGESTLTRSLCKASTRIPRLVSEQPCNGVVLGISN